MVERKIFETPSAFRAWIEENHETANELVVGFHKRASGKKSITWPESVYLGIERIALGCAL